MKGRKTDWILTLKQSHTKLYVYGKTIRTAYYIYDVNAV